MLSHDSPSRDYTGYLNLAMIFLGVHFSHAVVDMLSTVFEWGIHVSKYGGLMMMMMMMMMMMRRSSRHRDDNDDDDDVATCLHAYSSRSNR